MLTKEQIQIVEGLVVDLNTCLKNPRNSYTEELQQLMDSALYKIMEEDNNEN